MQTCSTTKIDPVSEVENTLTIACVYDMPIDMGDVSPVGSRRLHRCDLQVLLQRRARVILLVVVKRLILFLLFTFILNVDIAVASAAVITLACLFGILA